jgi:hypothetical protein
MMHSLLLLTTDSFSDQNKLGNFFDNFVVPKKKKLRTQILVVAAETAMTKIKQAILPLQQNNFPFFLCGISLSLSLLYSKPLQVLHV